MSRDLVREWSVCAQCGWFHPTSFRRLEGLPNEVLAAQSRSALPDEHILTAELEKTQRGWELRKTDDESSSPPPKAKRSKNNSETE